MKGSISERNIARKVAVLLYNRLEMLIMLKIIYCFIFKGFIFEHSFANVIANEQAHYKHQVATIDKYCDIFFPQNRDIIGQSSKKSKTTQNFDNSVLQKTK